MYEKKVFENYVGIQYWIHTVYKIKQCETIINLNKKWTTGMQKSKKYNIIINKIK